MTHDDFKAQYRTPEWKAKRSELIKKAGGKCETCGSDKHLQVHHPRYIKGRKAWQYDDLQCLCASCHRKADWARKQGLNTALPTTRNPLAGKFFHSFNQNGNIEWQGEVLGEVQPGFFLVQLFSWIMGENSNCEIVPFEDMLGWFFYQDADDMRFSYEEGAAKRFRSKD